MFGNHNGEFVFEVRPGDGLTLCLPIAARGQIEIPLDPWLGSEPMRAVGSGAGH
jgi:hypothetical protein